jgi:uncharacterized membrane protein
MRSSDAPVETKVFLQPVNSQIARLKSAIGAYDFKAFKSFGAARDAEAPKPLSALSKAQLIQQIPAPMVLLRQADSLTGDLRPHAQPLNSYRAFDEKMTMETSIIALPFDRANTLANVALVSLIVGVVITVSATIALIWLSGIKSRYINENLAQIMAQSDQAKAEVARANERAAEFLLRAQQASVEQEKTKLQLEQTRAVTAWRRLSSEQHTKIVNMLTGHAMTVNLLSSNNDAEAAQFAGDIARALRDAGVTVNSTTSVLPVPIHGLAMSMSSKEGATTLFMALRGAGLEIKDLPERDPVMIVVGSKPSA